MKTMVLLLMLAAGCGAAPCPDHTTEVDGGACQLDSCFDFAPDGGVDPDPFYVCGEGNGTDGAWGCRCTR